jgi:hypothetical protein
MIWFMAHAVWALVRSPPLSRQERTAAHDDVPDLESGASRCAAGEVVDDMEVLA